MFKSKKIPLPARPEPPTLENLHKDIENSFSDDVAFTCRDDFNLPFTDTSAILPQAKDSFEESISSDPDSSAFENDSDVDKNIEKHYQKFVKLVDMHNKLESAKKSLQEQSDHLLSLQLELKQGMEDLKHQAAAANINI